MKEYTKYMDEISADELYQGLLVHGLFYDKLPPIFSSESFYRYCKSKVIKTNKNSDFITFAMTRNIGIPRQINIPDPFIYNNLCRSLRDNWEDIKKYFYFTTHDNEYKVSRIHIRKINGLSSIFKMTYSNWKVDGTPQDNLLIGYKYNVHADIANCFPSTSHSSIILAFNEAIKQGYFNGDKSIKTKLNEIKALCKKINNGNNKGFLVGPHAYNLLSEIILTQIDKRLYDNGWRFIRFIDDYHCHVRNKIEADKFIIDLKNALKDYDQLINHKKISIDLIITSSIAQWKRNLDSFNLISHYGIVTYKEAKNYLSYTAELALNNNNDAGILNYAIKVLSGQKMSKNAISYIVKQCLHLAIIYPYLLSIIDEFVLTRYKVPKELIKEFSNILYDESYKIYNPEGILFSIYYSLKYDFLLDNIDPEQIIKMNDCLVNTVATVYYKKLKDKISLAKFQDMALFLTQNYDIGKNWLFIFEALSKNKLNGQWKILKKENVSFLRKEFQFTV